MSQPPHLFGDETLIPPRSPQVNPLVIHARDGVLTSWLNAIDYQHNEEQMGVKKEGAFSLVGMGACALTPTGTYSIFATILVTFHRKDWEAIFYLDRAENYESVFELSKETFRRIEKKLLNLNEP